MTTPGIRMAGLEKNISKFVIFVGCLVHVFFCTGDFFRVEHDSLKYDPEYEEIPYYIFCEPFHTKETERISINFPMAGCFSCIFWGIDFHHTTGKFFHLEHDYH